MPHRPLATLVLTVAMAMGLLGARFHASAQIPAGTAALPSSGSVLESDDFSSPSDGLLPRISPQPGDCQEGYIAGEYQIAKTNPRYSKSCSVNVEGSSNFADVSIAVDVHLKTEDANKGQFVHVNCRHQRAVAPDGGLSFLDYIAHFVPTLGLVQLYRTDALGTVNLTKPKLLDNSPPEAGRTFHLEMTCSGSSISFAVDGKVIASAQDTALSSGQVSITAGVEDCCLPGTVDARFSHLVLTQP